MKAEFDFPSPYWDPVSQLGKDFIKKLLVVDPKKRLTAEQALEDSWITVKKSFKKIKTIYSPIFFFHY